MNLKRIPVYLGTGCLSVLLGVTVAGAQSDQSSPAAASQGSTGTAGAQDMSSATGNSGRASMTDKKFVKEAMQGSMAEIKLGQLAQEKASSDDVKQFGKRMVDDHTKLSEQMKPVASQLGITAPSDVAMKDKALEKKLEGLNGAEFDKAYMKAMVKDHRKDLSEFQKEASSAKSGAVKDAAQQGSQVISEHLQMAQQIAQKVGANTSESTNSNTGNLQNGSPSTTGAAGMGTGQPSNAGAPGQPSTGSGSPSGSSPR